jgi:pimeloyl-ACP methyl ester carboxylesterase
MRYQFDRRTAAGAAMTAPTTHIIQAPGATLIYETRTAPSAVRGTDGANATTPEELSLVIAALGAGPVDAFASSRGAINALALVARHPEQVPLAARISCLDTPKMRSSSCRDRVTATARLDPRRGCS